MLNYARVRFRLQRMNVIGAVIVGQKEDDDYYSKKAE